jgi:hypothetical protein
VIGCRILVRPTRDTGRWSAFKTVSAPILLVSPFLLTTTSIVMHWSPKYRGSSEQCPACRALVRPDPVTAELWWCGACRVWWGFTVDGSVRLPGTAVGGSGGVAARDAELGLQRRCS